MFYEIIQNMNVKNLVRKNISRLIPYQSARKIGGNGRIWLNANESPNFDYFNLTSVPLNRYPECQPKKLLELYASYVKLKTQQVLITRGADEAIELLIKTFCEPNKDKIIFFPPTYDMYEISANIIGVKSIGIPLLQSFQLDINSVVNKIDNVKLIYICNPNNPTGNLIDIQDIIFLLKLTCRKALVIVDEAYIEFCSKYSMVSLIKKYTNLVILRTLSKAFSLAGLRCGFILSDSNIIQLLSKVINPYPVPIPVSDIAVQSLSENGIHIMNARVTNLNHNRSWFIKQLRFIRCIDTIFNSEANYFLVKFFNSEVFFKGLWCNRIIVRDQSKKIHLKNCVRISVGTRFECSEVIRMIRNIDRSHKDIRR